MRTFAQDIREPAIKANFMRIAEDYDRLAQQAEERLPGAQPHQQAGSKAAPS